jgi:uncharacterized sulfatase
MKRTVFLWGLLLICLLFANLLIGFKKKSINKLPNILLAISDDQSYPHAGIYGCKSLRTPGFDRVAHEGVLFTNAFAAAPGFPNKI